MAFTAELPMDLPPPGYFIYRDIPAGEPIDPATTPTIFPPKDSDELFDALRGKYPHLKTHSERMRDAILEFLLEELQAEQIQRTSPTTSFGTSPTNIFDPASTTPQWQQSQSWPSISSDSISTFSSPETLGLATPTYGMSPYPQAAQMSRQYSTAASTMTTSADSTPPALESMTAVFSVCSSNQPKQRIRRKMTEAEKIEYRQRRIVKACEKCQKRKRKCDHNQPDLDNLNAKSHKQKSAATASKVKKTQHQTTTAKPAVATATLQEHDTFMDFTAFNFDDSFNTDMQLFDNFTNFFDDSVMQPDFDQYKQFDNLAGVGGETGNRAHDGRGQLRWDDSQHDWTMPDVGHGSLGIIGNMQHTTGGRNLQTPTSMNNANANEARKFDGVQRAVLNENMLLKTREHPHLLCSTINTRGQPQGIPENGRQEPNGNGMLWEHLRTGQGKIEPTHSPHGLEAEGQGSYVFDKAGRCSSGNEMERRPDTMHTDEFSLGSSVPAIRRTQKAFGTNPLSQGATSPGLPSTSVAQPSGTLFRDESAARQGRPVPTLGHSEGITRAASPSTELFMLKRRLPNAPHTSLATNQLQGTETEPRPDFIVPRDARFPGQAYQANGGAYPRLETDNCARPEAVDAGTSPAADKPTPNQSRNAISVFPSQAALSRQAGARPGPHTEVGCHDAKLRPASGSATRGPAECVDHSLADHIEVHEDRLRDTFRRRDHFGSPLASATRAATAAAAAAVAEQAAQRPGHGHSDMGSALAVLGGMLILAALLPPAHAANLALLALALASPGAGAKGTHFRARAWRFWSPVWGTLLQCTIKNSAWLGLLRVRPAEVATEALPAGCWHDGAWPGTSGEGMGRRLVGGWG
ncbi:hypothetical protein LTR36_001452 [Oleoguttula mirabilis]|uniref:Zn(2)-C6 fungal-type domain-containing protein n=1 Tax=Oleoguttula mirabilis TaxID=1507867 RepID=A0AAV9J3C7_9PEZI|nr:hypothetical protein LTR36_001452 [Oleoguttula mirabilis]